MARATSTVASSRSTTCTSSPSRRSSILRAGVTSNASSVPSSRSAVVAVIAGKKEPIMPANSSIIGSMNASIRPMRIHFADISRFMQLYLEECGALEKLDPIAFHEYCARLAQIVVTTTAGRARLRAAAPTYLGAIDEHFGQHLSPREVAAVLRALTKVVRAEE